MGKKYYFGIDIGGTFIKGAIVDSDGNITVSSKVPTGKEGGGEKVLLNIKSLCDTLLDMAKMKKSDITALGMGMPGIIDNDSGTVILAENLNWHNFPIRKLTEDLIGLPVKIGNDANLAALAEIKFGFKDAYKNMIMLTLGTGVGGGIIIDGKVYTGNLGAGAELGHHVIVMGGEPCSCGRRGCLEAYSSATALIRDTKRKMAENRNSKMWEIGSLDNVTGKTAFDYQHTDASAKSVVDGYVEKLACGIANFANIFRPEAVILGGGVCAQGDSLINPLKKLLENEIFAAKEGPKVELFTARLGNDAGSIGAAALVM